MRRRGMVPSITGLRNGQTERPGAGGGLLWHGICRMCCVLCAVIFLAAPCLPSCASSAVRRRDHLAIKRGVFGSRFDDWPLGLRWAPHIDCGRLVVALRGGSLDGAGVCGDGFVGGDGEVAVPEMPVMYGGGDQVAMGLHGVSFLQCLTRFSPTYARAHVHAA